MKFNLDKKALNLILKFEKISFIFSLIGSLILYIHLKFYIDNILFEIGINIFKIGLISGISSFCFGTFFNRNPKRFNKIKKSQKFSTFGHFFIFYQSLLWTIC